VCLDTNPSTHIAGQLRYLNRDSHDKVDIGVDLIVYLSNSGVAKESNAGIPRPSVMREMLVVHVHIDMDRGHELSSVTV
jgi:hypothetical protein